MIATEEESLQREAEIFSRYLLGEAAAEDLVLRYARANRVLGLSASGALASDAALVDFCRRHPWALAALDAACGWLAPDCLLRRKILTMAAILETTPRHASEFFGRTSAPALFYLRTTGLALRAAGLAAVGSLFYLAIRSRAGSGTFE